ncbi:MAG: PxxKW family cysteine-rich protein [Desulfobacterales bacterium]|nr:PxxKW family cysteine-rich protein [Desulfobacterales bacterium]
MKCTTIREGVECPFMTAKGCSYTNGACLEIIEACKGCARSKEFKTGWYCMTCPDPASKWKHGHCNMATHVTMAVEKKAAAKLNPIKASKRGNR